MGVLICASCLTTPVDSPAHLQFHPSLVATLVTWPLHSTLPTSTPLLLTWSTLMLDSFLKSLPCVTCLPSCAVLLIYQTQISARGWVCLLCTEVFIKINRTQEHSTWPFAPH